MNKLFLALILLISFTAQSQTVYPAQGTPKGTNTFLGTLVVDTALAMPLVYSAPMISAYYNPAVRKTGIFKWNPITNQLWGYNGTGFVQVNAGGGGGAVNSLTTIGSSGPATLTSGVLNIPQYSGSGGAITRKIPLRAAIPFNYLTTAMDSVLGGDIYFTVDSTSAQPGFGSIARVKANGHNIIFDSKLRKVLGSPSPSGSSQNIIAFSYDGTEYNYCVINYNPIFNWQSLIWTGLMNVIKTGNNYVNAPLTALGRMFDPSDYIPSSSAGAFRIDATMNFTMGLHTVSSQTDGVYFYYSAKRDNNQSLFEIRENSIVTAYPSVPIGATNYALFKDDFGTVTFRYSTDNGASFPIGNILHTYSNPSTTNLYPLGELGYNGIQVPLANPQLLIGN